MYKKERKNIQYVTILKLFVTGIITFTIFFFFLRNKQNNTPEQRDYLYCQNENNKEYFGVVEAKTKGRIGWGFKLSSGVFFSPILECWKMGKEIEVSDSIFKPSGTFDLYIYKGANPDSVIFIPCDFDYKNLLK